MKKHILVTGATGMVGKALLQSLHQKGYTITVLSRKPTTVKNAKVYLWDVQKQQIDLNCLTDVDTIIHLAGASVAEKKWTKARKKEIIDSRVQSTQLLYKSLKEHPNNVQNFISASAVGYYGDCGDEILTEECPNGFGFLAECCQLWENAVDEMKHLDLRVAKIRIGFVLGKSEGALPALEKPIRFFVGAPLGSGKQWIPWIHLHDLVNIFIAAIETPLMMGAYNASAPYPVTNETLTKAVAKQIHRPVWPIKVPEKILELLLGEMSVVVAMSNNTSVQKLLGTGFQFDFVRLEDALDDIYHK